MSTGTHEEWSFDRRVARLRVEVSEVPRLLEEVSDTMLSIGRSSLSMAPSRGSDRPLPGGVAIVLRGPVADHATVGDSLPHPVTVMRRVADLVREWMGERSVPSERLDAAVAFIDEHAAWIVAHEELAVWVEAQVASALGLLRSLVGDVEREEPRTIEAGDVQARMEALLAERPEAYWMTPAEADHFWPGIASRIKAHRSRARARARSDSKLASEEAGHRVDIEPEFFAEPDSCGRYCAADLAEFHRQRGHVRTGVRASVGLAL